MVAVLEAAQANGTLEELLGYDPWNFPNVANPRRDIAYLTFGGCLYEFIDCATILLRARTRRKAGIFQAIALGIILNFEATVLGILGFSSTPEVADDFFRGPREFAIVVICLTSVMLARWAYFYGAMVITLAVYPTNKAVRSLVCTVTALGVIGSFCCTVCICQFFRLTFDQYRIYMETSDRDAVMVRIHTTILPSIPAVATSEMVAAITMVVFMLFTKIPFLWEIFRSLNVPFYEAMKEMATTQSTQRIATSSLWSVVEIISMSAIGMSDLSFAIAVFSMMFQLNTLAMLAFQGSSAIINKYGAPSAPSSFPASVDQKSQLASAMSPTPPRPVTREGTRTQEKSQRAPLISGLTRSTRGDRPSQTANPALPPPKKV